MFAHLIKSSKNVYVKLLFTPLSEKPNSGGASIRTFPRIPHDDTQRQGQQIGNWSRYGKFSKSYVGVHFVKIMSEMQQSCSY